METKSVEIQLCQKGGADESEAQAKLEAEAANPGWSAAADRRALWMRCGWLLESSTRLSTALAIEAGCTLAGLR